MTAVSMRRRRWAIGLSIAFAAVSSVSEAQPARTPASAATQTAQAPVLPGEPSNPIPGTGGVPLFSSESAAAFGAILAKARDAAARCDRAAYDAALHEWDAYATNLWGSGNLDRDMAKYSKTAAGTATVRQQGDQRVADGATASSYKANSPDFPQFPKDCDEKNKAARVNAAFFLTGSATVPMVGGGLINGVDMTPGVGNFLLSTGTYGPKATTFGQAGARARVYVPTSLFDYLMTGRRSRPFLSIGGFPLPPSGPPQAPVPQTQLFIESGIQSGFGAQSFVQPFTGINAFPQGFGTSSVTENFQVPILIGASVPVGSLGGSPLSVEAYTGIMLDSWTHTLSGREAGAPAGGGIFSQSGHFSVDPTLGVGARINAGPFILGADAELMFRPGSVAIAHSSNFNETYYSTIFPQPTLNLMVRVGIPLGRR